MRIAIDGPVAPDDALQAMSPVGSLLARESPRAERAVVFMPEAGV
jgi:hypothetical protein